MWEMCSSILTVSFFLSMKNWCSTQGQRSCPWEGTRKRWGRYRRLTMAMEFLTLSNITVIRSTGEKQHTRDIHTVCPCHMTAPWDVSLCTLKLYNMSAATLCFHSWLWCLRSVNWPHAHHVIPAHCQMRPIIPAWRVMVTSVLLNHSTKTLQPSPNRWAAALTANQINCASINTRDHIETSDIISVYFFF